jgi:transposase InsO family protein
VARERPSDRAAAAGATNRPPREPDAGNLHVRFDESTGRLSLLMVVGVASVVGAKTAEMFFLDRRTIAASPARNFLYLVVIMDWVSRAVLAWRLSNTLGAEFCVEALEKALSRYGRPETRR